MKLVRNCRLLALPPGVVVCVLAALFVLCARPAAAQEKELANQSASAEMDVEFGGSRDVICGPRCVSFLLNYYRLPNNPSLTQIVRDLQWPDLRAGSSMADLKEYLAKYDVQSEAVRLSPHTTLDWDYPCLVYLPVRGSQVGHYAVWLPESTRSTARIWNGGGGPVELPTWRFAEKAGSYALLTRPGNAHNYSGYPGRAVILTTDGLLWRLGWCTVAAISLLGFVMSFRHRHKVAASPDSPQSAKALRATSS